MGEADKFSGKVTAEEVFFRALLNITQLATNIYGTTTTDWQRNALNYEAAINELEALAGPFLGEDFFDRVDEMQRLAEEYYLEWQKSTPKQQLVKSGRDMEVKLTLEVANSKLALIQDVLHAKGIFFGRTYQATPGEEAVPAPVPVADDVAPDDDDGPVPGVDDVIPDDEPEAEGE